MKEPDGENDHSKSDSPRTPVDSDSAPFPADTPDVPILWDGGCVLAVAKPAGLATQAPPGIDSLETRLRIQLSRQQTYLAMPHRLDRPVAGVSLVALTKKAARLLSEQFAARKVQKKYLAVTAGTLQQSSETWIDQVCKCVDRAKCEIVHEPPPEATLRAARTTPRKTFSATTRLLSVWAGSDVTVMEFSPVTGRMHQLRVQSAVRKAPLVGDDLYGCQATPEIRRRVFRNNIADGAIALAATEIEFFHPSNGRVIRVHFPATSRYFAGSVGELVGGESLG